jgi:hypothetical protein
MLCYSTVQAENFAQAEAAIRSASTVTLLKPVDGTKPSNLTKLTNSTNPTDPTDPINPTNSINPINPTNPTNPNNPTNPINPTNPTNPNNPTNPTDPTNPTNPAKIRGANKGPTDLFRLLALARERNWLPLIVFSFSRREVTQYIHYATCTCTTE